jgi:hypothetical protein
VPRPCGGRARRIRRSHRGQVGRGRTDRFGEGGTSRPGTWPQHWSWSKKRRAPHRLRGPHPRSRRKALVATNNGSFHDAMLESVGHASRYRAIAEERISPGEALGWKTTRVSPSAIRDEDVRARPDTIEDRPRDDPEKSKEAPSGGTWRNIARARRREEDASWAPHEGQDGPPRHLSLPISTPARKRRGAGLCDTDPAMPVGYLPCRGFHPWYSAKGIGSRSPGTKTGSFRSVPERESHRAACIRFRPRVSVEDGNGPSEASHDDRGFSVTMPHPPPLPNRPPEPGADRVPGVHSTDLTRALSRGAGDRSSRRTDGNPGHDRHGRILNYNHTFVEMWGVPHYALESRDVLRVWTSSARRIEGQARVRGPGAR